MSERITREFTPTILEAFGATEDVRRGKEAEDLYFDYAKAVYDDVISHESDQEKQNQGIDFTIFRKRWVPEGYTVQVKKGATKKEFTIDNRPNGWLRNPTQISDRIVLVDLKGGWAVDFRRKDMIDFIDNWTPIPKDQKEIVMDIFDKRYPPKLIHNQNLMKPKNHLKNFIVKNPNEKTVEV